MARKPSKEELIVLTKLIDYAQQALKYALTDHHCAHDGQPMYPVAISLINFTVTDLNELIEGEE